MQKLQRTMHWKKNDSVCVTSLTECVDSWMLEINAWQIWKNNSNV